MQAAPEATPTGPMAVLTPYAGQTEIELSSLAEKLGEPVDKTGQSMKATAFLAKPQMQRDFEQRYLDDAYYCFSPADLAVEEVDDVVWHHCLKADKTSRVDLRVTKADARVVGGEQH